jgi:hypothetical protein
VFHDNNSLWRTAIAAKAFYYGARIGLDNFFLFEWFPRSPGLYWTSRAKHARDQAKHRIIEVRRGGIVYDPYGKQSMLDGGIGSIRLNPIILHNTDWMLMSASSSGVCHQGFPVALTLDLYREYIDEIRTRGAVVCTLLGQLRTIPKELSEVYSGYTEVPKLYLQVEKIQRPRVRKSRSMENLEVSVAASFTGKVDEKPGIYATYVSFDPARKGHFARAIEWMRDEYVHSYKGTILTDFDEQENHFPEARFSLEKVMQLKLEKRDFSGIHINIGNVEKLIAFQAEIKKQTNYTVTGGNVGALGDNARAKDFSQAVQRTTLSPKRRRIKRRLR